jgi:predicted RND superfamily exporter protein
MANPLSSPGLTLRMPKSQLAVAFFVLGSLLLLIQPIPSFLLDALIVVSLGSSVLTLMVVLFLRDPAEFSTFPTLLLITTLFRLGLNVASTRLILSTGEAGQIISAFGEQVVGGNYVIGVIIFALLVFMFHSFLRPFIIMLTIPLGLVGFSVAFWLHGKPISFLALIGIIGLTGIIVNSGIVLIEFIEIARREGMAVHEALVRASSQRLLAVVATAFSTVLGLFPTAYGIGGSDEMLIPITLAMAWGLTSGTLLTLVFIPPAYAIIEDWMAWLSKTWIARFMPTWTKEAES